MFRAQINQMADGPTLELEGCLVAEWANEAKSLMRSGPVPKGLIVDITDVSYIDSVGEQVLAWLASIGASSQIAPEISPAVAIPASAISLYRLAIYAHI
jgi:anti-anti-sigma regulatory factor